MSMEKLCRIFQQICRKKSVAESDRPSTETQHRSLPSRDLKEGMESGRKVPGADVTDADSSIKTLVDLKDVFEFLVSEEQKIWFNDVNSVFARSDKLTVKDDQSLNTVRSAQTSSFLDSCHSSESFYVPGRPKTNAESLANAHHTFIGRIIHRYITSNFKSVILGLQ